jgi:hypothetical protein
MYQLACECTKTLAVTLADAGATLPCNCGPKVDIPPLHQLRILAGENVLSPVVKIRTLLLDNQLPGTQECVRCGNKTDNTVKVEIKFEWAIINSGIGGGERIAGYELPLSYFKNDSRIQRGKP